MTGISLFDRLADDPSRRGEGVAPDLTLSLADQMMAAALAGVRMLRRCEDMLFPPEGDAAALATAEVLHAEFCRWADDADAVLERAARLEAAGARVAGFAELRHAVGRTRAMLQITPRQHLEALAQVRRGEVHTLEEVRRDLRLGVHG